MAENVAEQTRRGKTRSFGGVVRAAASRPLRGTTIDTVQANIGLVCNLACRHCHVESSPKRTEAMTWETMEAVLDAAEQSGAHTLDITGGAPEMHPHFRDFVDAGLARGLHLMVRTNLTILLHAGYADYPDFYAQRGVHLVASLPCYLPNNVDKQRGRHVYKESIEVIQRLNAVGYGTKPELQLDLVYNPGGPSLPPDQHELETAYREKLSREFTIHFNRLYTITNLAIGRFLRDLEKAGQSEQYQQLLRDAFNPATVDGLMCRHQLHVGWDGRLYDCDFNYAIGLQAVGSAHITQFNPESFRTRPINTGEHCFACTAGCGSSCSGALA